MIVFCPGCGSKISVAANSPGGEVNCPSCKSTFSTAGVKSAANAAAPRRFRPKKSGNKGWTRLAIAMSILLVSLGGATAILYYTGHLNRWIPTNVASSLGGALSGGASWHEYTSTEGKFRVNFPGTPTREAHPVSGTTAGAKHVAISFTSDTPDVKYSVSFEDFDHRSDTPAQFIDRQKAAITKRAGYKIGGETEVALGKHKGKEYVIEHPVSGTAHVRFFAVGNRLYKLTAYAPKRPVQATESAKLFDSFQVIE